MKFIQLLVSLAFITLTSCHWHTTDDASNPAKNRIPVFKEEWSDLPSDVDFRNAVSVINVIETETMLDSYYKLLQAAYLTDKLKGLQNVTVFAPTNEAINDLTEDRRLELMHPTRINDLKHLLNYHVVKNAYDYNALLLTIRQKKNSLKLETLNNRFIAFSADDDHIYLTDESGNQSYISQSDLKAENGVVHGITNLLQPQNLQ